MLQDYSSKSVLVYDYGTFVEFAITLSKHFGKTYYHSPWESSFPKSNDVLVGYGLPGIERVNSFFDVVNDVDLFVFPDIYGGSLQVYLDSIGKRVWGSRYGEGLEIYREEAKEYMSSMEIPIGKYNIVVGLDALREYLQDHENQWVKIEFTRGDMETFDSKNYDLIEPKLDELEHTLGAKKEIMKFIVEDAIPDAVEIGYDGYTIDGQFPTQGMWGIEIKDKGYVGVFSKYSDMPKPVTDINAKLAAALKEYRYRNFFSTEMRLTMKDRVPYVIDPCCRAGSPPSELYQKLYTNLPDIIWYGAEGKVIDPIPAGKYGAEIMIHSTWAEKNWQAINFPEELRDNIKFRNLTIINDKYYVIPERVGLPEIAAVVAIGDDLDEVIEEVKGYAEKVEGYYIDIFPDALDTAHDEIEKLKKVGIDFKPSSHKDSDMTISKAMKVV
jgi:hypothetical protein